MSGTPLRELGGQPPAWSPAQRWVLASQGVLTELYRSNIGRMGGLPRPLGTNIAALFLRRDWGVRTGREARRVLDALLERVKGLDDVVVPAHPPPALLAWDMVRAAAFAGWSYVSYHVEADEAWRYMVRAARVLRRHYDSWEAIGAAYLRIRNQWGGGGDAELGPVLERLHAPGGGWDLPWEIDLSGDIPAPVETLRSYVVDAARDDADFRTIGEAVAAARKAQQAARIVVRAGTYAESVRIGYSVELVADGEVTIRSATGAPISLTKDCALVRGFRLIAGTNDAGEAMQGVWTDSFFLKLVDCTIASERCGVYAHSDKAFVSLQGCSIEAARFSGVLSEEGAHTVLVDTVIRNTGGAGVFVSGNAELRIEDCRVEGSGNTGVSVSGTVLAEIDGLAIERSKHNGVDVLEQARAVIEKLAVTHAAQTGLLAASPGDVQLVASSITGSGGNDLGVLAGRVVARDCTFGGGPGCGVCVGSGAIATLVQSTVDSTAMPSVVIMGGGTGELAQCQIRGGRDMALWVMPDGSATVNDCTIDGGAKTGVLLREPRSVSVEGGTITSESSALFCVGGPDVIVRGTTLSGGSPAVCAQEGAQLVLADTRISTEGDVALAVEGKAAAVLTRVDASAPRGKALALEHGSALAYRSALRGVTAASIDGESRLRAWATDHAGALDGSVERIDTDEALHAPGSLTLLRGERACVVLDAQALHAAFVPFGLEPGGERIAVWLDSLFATASLAAPVEVYDGGEGAELHAETLASLHAALAHVRRALDEPAHLAKLASTLREHDARGAARDE